MRGALIVVVVLRLAASFSTPATTVMVEPQPGSARGQGTIVSVTKGSFEWLAGVRVGETYDPWESGGGGYATVRGAQVSLPDFLPEKPVTTALASVALLVLGALVAPVSALGAGVAVFGATALAASDLVGVIAMPIALFVLIVPSLAAFPVAWCLYDRRWRLSLSLILATIGASVVGGALFATDSETWRHIWLASSGAPAIVVIAVGISASVMTARRARMSMMRRRGIAESLMAETGVGQRALRMVREDSRDLAARTLHDRVLPSLIASVRALEAGHLERGTTLLGGLMHDVRNDLEEEQLVALRVGGLSGAAEGPIRRLEATGVACVRRVANTADRPPWEVEVAAFRILQEALSNVAAHASADQVTIDIVAGHRQVRLEVIDDGVGMDLPRTSLGPGREHLGITGMLMRAQEVGGRLDIRSGRPAGTTVAFLWPA